MRTQIQVRTLRELMAGHTKAEIKNLFGGNVVRKLEITPEHPNDVEIDWLGPVPGITGTTTPASLDQPIYFDPWMMDRGSMLIQCKFAPEGMGKLCTQYDIIMYEDGTEASIDSHPESLKTDHEVRIREHTPDGPLTTRTRSNPLAGGMF